MSILIKGMEMPTGNNKLRLIIHSNGQVIISHKMHYEETEAVSVPPHGDLIDRDVLTDAIDSINWYHQAPNKDMVDGADSAKHQAWYKVQDVYSAVDNAPTIIPAEEGEM